MRLPLRPAPVTTPLPRKALPALPALLVLLLAATTLPVAGAHVENYSEAGSFDLGDDYSAFLDPQKPPLYAGSTVTLTAYITDKSTGALVQNGIQVFANLSAPGGYQKTVELKHDGARSYLNGVVVTQPGEHTVVLSVHDDAGVHEGTTSFAVYPDLPVRFSPADAEADQYANVTTPMQFQVIDPRTYGPADLDDVTLRIEHWTDDHETMLDADEMPLRKGQDTIWETEYVFPQRGMYHLRFASDSGGFTYDDVPLLHIYAQDGAPPEPARAETPAAGATAALAAIALVAAALRRPRK